MGLPVHPLAPAQIFVCRHGARLDASDSTWHLTSPTPYDPPLTYGGWTQARTLGSRIAAHIIAQISSEYPIPSSAASTKKPTEKAGVWSAAPAGGKETKREPTTAPTAAAVPPVSRRGAVKLNKTRIVVHTSPFLRCVQTSIAAVAGMSQYFSDVGVSTAASISTEEEGVPLLVAPRPMLRIDGFLGEWLCEDYFADITPPPASDLMIGTAKIDLMRPSSAGGLRGGAPAGGQHAHIHQRAHSVGFVPPVPTSAVGKNEPIPRGHVSYAREFLDVDYSYDSLRYGDGGEYGEEWGRMHKRVKVGFEKIVGDYVRGDVKPCLKGSSGSGSAPAATSFSELAAAAEAKNEGKNKGEEEAHADEEVTESTVMVFISHGAICNALVGAMTLQPVLMDMGIASMSMGILLPSFIAPSIPPQSTPPPLVPAVQQQQQQQLTAPDTPPLRLAFATDDFDGLSSPSSNASDKDKPFIYAPPAAVTVAESMPRYDVRVIASTEHLRTGAASVKSPQVGATGGQTGARGTPPLRPRKPSVGGGFSMYNTAGRLPGPLIGSAGTADSGTGSGGNGGGSGSGTTGTGLLPVGRAMGMVFGGGGGGAHAMGVRRTASAAAATKGLWSLPAAAEMGRGSSDEDAVLTDEDSGEDRKDEEEEGKKAAGVERKGSVSGGGGMWGAKAAAGKPTGLWGSASGAPAERRRRSTVTNRKDVV